MPKRRQAKNAKYCSFACASKAVSSKSKSLNVHRTWQVPSGTVGAIHELAVCADLMKRGFHVFRAVSPSCVCDIAVLAGERLLRVEVTTGNVSGNGTLHYPSKDQSRFDLLAVVSGEAVHYMPPIETVIPIDGEAHAI